MNGHARRAERAIRDLGFAFDAEVTERHATLAPDAFGSKRSRPCGCVAIRPQDDTCWTALPRTTSDAQPGDLPSPAMPGIGLDRDGAWTLRWVHQVRKDKTGEAACEFLGALPDEERDRLLAFYRNRHS